MRRQGLIALLLALAAACGPKAAPALPVNTPPPTPEDVIKAVTNHVEQYRQAYEVRSMEALAPLYSHTDDLVVTHQGKTVVGWPAAQDQKATFLTKMVTIRVRVADLAIVALGDAGALASATVILVHGDGVQTVEESGTLTLVFRRVEDEWKIVAEHFSYAAVAQ